MTKFFAIALTISLLGVFSISAHDKKGKGHMGKEHFNKIDADSDGKISKEEWQKFHDTRFTEMDADNDGTLSHDEMKSYHKDKRKGKKK